MSRSLLFSRCSQRAYLLNMLRDQGLSKKNMDSVFHALILCKIRYALCAWGDHITEANRGKLMPSYAGCIDMDMGVQSIILTT